MLASSPNIFSFSTSVPAQTMTYYGFEVKTICCFCSILNNVAIWYLLYPGHDPKQSTISSISSNCVYTVSGAPAWDSRPTLVFGWFFSSVSAQFFPQSCDLVTSLMSTGPSGMKQITFNTNWIKRSSKWRTECTLLFKKFLNLALG